MLSLTLMPARQGDAIWIRWGETDAPRQMLVDMGTEEIGGCLRASILDLPEKERVFDLLVVTHVDRDHIGGVLTCIAEADSIPGFAIKDVWFNGYPHLSSGPMGPNALEPMGPAQGERLATWLRTQTWNRAFNGGAVVRRPGRQPSSIPLHDGLTLTVLGPTPERLAELEPVWKEEVEEALRKGKLTTVSPGLESLGSAEPPKLEDMLDLRALADMRTPPDPSKANGSSIALLVEYRGKSILLSGDAFATDLVAGIEALTGGRRLRLDAFKLPHHCSQSNVVKDLVAAVDCGCWLVSTDGTQFRHPDPVAVARIILHSTQRPPLLAFNVPSTSNGWWDNDAWRRLYGYNTKYGTRKNGLTVTFS